MDVSQIDFLQLLVGSALSFLLSYLYQRSKYSVSESKRKRSREIQLRKAFHSQSPSRLDTLRDAIAKQRNLTLTWLTTSCFIFSSTIVTALLPLSDSQLPFVLYLALFVLSLLSFAQLVFQRGKLSSLEAALAESSAALDLLFTEDVAEALLATAESEEASPTETYPLLPGPSGFFQDVSSSLEEKHTVLSAKRRART
ncbi:MAG: hypothetical protein AAGI52_05115 [Bacteroidota bacterium]